MYRYLQWIGWFSHLHLDHSSAIPQKKHSPVDQWPQLDVNAVPVDLPAMLLWKPVARLLPGLTPWIGRRIPPESLGESRSFSAKMGMAYGSILNMEKTMRIYRCTCISISNTESDCVDQVPIYCFSHQNWMITIRCCISLFSIMGCIMFFFESKNIIFSVIKILLLYLLTLK